MFKDAYKADNARIRPTPETRARILSTLRETQASGKLFIFFVVSEGLRRAASDTLVF